MKIARALVKNESWFVSVDDGSMTMLTPSPSSSTGAATMAALRASLAGSSTRLDASDVRLLCPVVAPQKVLAVGLNYHDHATEAGLPVPEAPVIFAKTPNALVGPDAAIQFSAGQSTQVDYEAELAVVIGERVRDVGPAKAIRAVFGYTVCNDVTARDAQFRDGQWCRSKSFDTFCPLGPWIVTADEIAEPQNLAVTCRVNGQQRQSGNTSQMVFSVAEIVSYLSCCMTLEPGDVITTGTPAGVGFGRRPPVYLADGDVIECEVQRVGVLRNHVVTTS